MSTTARAHLAFDALIRSLASLRPRRDWHANPGASLPGGQAHLTTEVLDPDGPDPVLRTGDTKHSLWRSVEWRLLRGMVPELPAPILDLGCGDGTFGALVRPRFDIGVDGDAEAVARCDQAVYAATATTDMRETLSVPDGSLAAVFSNSTLEHVVPLAPALQATQRALAPGGVLLATVPAAGLARAVAARYGAAFADHLNARLSHHNLWTWDRWRSELNAAGFDDVELRGYFSDEAACWFASRLLAPWDQLARRAPATLWRHDLPTLRRLVAGSLAVEAEDQTACLLIRARRST